MKIDIVDRAKRMILEPRLAWEVIDEEEHTVKDLFTGYVMILAAIPAVAGFLGFSIVGLGGYLSTYRIPIASGIAHMVIVVVSIAVNVIFRAITALAIPGPLRGF